MGWYGMMRQSMVIRTLQTFTFLDGLVLSIDPFWRYANLATIQRIHIGLVAVRRCFVWILQLLFFSQGFVFVCELGLSKLLSWYSYLEIFLFVQEWRTHFKYGDENSQYLLGDLEYMGAKIFILHWIGVYESPSNVPCNVIDAFNKMHAYYMIYVEWGIGGLKRKFASWWSDSTLWNPIKHTLFRSCVFLANFFHRRRMNLSQEIIKNKVDNSEAHGFGVGGGGGDK